MSETDDTIAYCHACGTAMDVDKVAPFSNVECPSCKKHTRVKREFGPYTLLRRHAIGGMSMVFVGHDNTLDREVAVKILSEDYSADEKRIAAFEEEARITASFTHPHVVRVFKTGKAFGRLYIAMELVAGGHLEHQIKERGKIPEKEALQLAIQVADGLKAAHSAGLLHRDIKPGNILLDSGGSAKIVDFGLALMTKAGVAKPDEMWATPFYVPPETVDGLEEDYRADMYAFGSTFYHALAGKPPCTEESMVTTQLREAKKHVIPLSIACPHLSMDTAAVIECAMAYNPSQRFSSYDEMIELLQAALVTVQVREKNIKKGIPVPAAVTAATAANRRQVAKKKTAETAIVWTAVILVIGVALWALKTFILSTKPDPVIIETPIELNPIATDTSGVAIGNLYLEARKQLQNKDFEQARSAFLQLRANGKCQEPTKTWCAFEALMASFLDGKTSVAMEDGDLLSTHLGTGNAPDNMSKRLLPWIGELQNYPPLKDGAISNKGDEDLLYLMTCMASACKNWEQGKMAEAIPLFNKVKNAPQKGGNELLVIYQKFAADYISDWAKLQSNNLDKLPTTIALCKERSEALNGVLSSLDTRGRAKFQVREWQMLLEREARRLENPDATNAKSITLDEALAQLPKLNATCQFLDAAEIIKKVKTSDVPQLAKRTALLSMYEAAGLFIADLENDLNKAAIDAPIQSRDGKRSFTRALSAENGTVTLLSGESESSLNWHELRPTDVISLSVAAIRRNASEQNKAMRYEAAVAFQYLSGETAAAEVSAGKLGATSPAFKTRWTTWMAAIK
jgi:serine/threonine protein kinase